MKANRLFLSAVVAGLALPNPCYAQAGPVLRKAVQEVVEHVTRKFGKEVAEEGVEALAKKIEQLALKHGDDALVAVRKVGPRTIKIVEEAGEHAPQAVKLMSRHGNDAVWVVANKNRLAIFAKFGDDAAESMIKHGEIAEPLLESFGKPAAAALKGVNSQNARRLAMMADSGDLARIGRTPELLEVVGKYGDRAADFIWRNKGALTVTAALAAFLADPEPFLNGVRDLTESVTENMVKPVAEVPAQVASEVARNTNWTVVLVSGLAILGLLVGIRMWLRRRTSGVQGLQPPKTS